MFKTDGYIYVNPDAQSIPLTCSFSSRRIFTSYFFIFCPFRFFENFVIHRRRRFCHVGELNVENEINVLNLNILYLKEKNTILF